VIPLCFNCEPYFYLNEKTCFTSWSVRLILSYQIWAFAILLLLFFGSPARAQGFVFLFMPATRFGLCAEDFVVVSRCHQIWFALPLVFPLKCGFMVFSLTRCFFFGSALPISLSVFARVLSDQATCATLALVWNRFPARWIHVPASRAPEPLPARS
jgi:hypothetical protein